MLVIDPQFKSTMQDPVKTPSGYIVLQDGSEMHAGDDLQKYTITSTGSLLKTGMSKIVLTLIGKHDLVGTAIDVYYGVKIDSSWEYVLRGKFNITKVTYKEDNNTTEVTGFDNMLYFNVPYAPSGEYPMTLIKYLALLCSLAGVVLENDTIYNGSLTIPEDYYKNISEYTLRDILDDICEASASYAIINSGGNLELRQISDTGETLTYEQMKKYKVGDKWGEVNSLVLSRQPQNDDVYVRNEEDIIRPTTRNILDLRRFNVGYSMEEQ